MFYSCFNKLKMNQKIVEKSRMTKCKDGENFSMFLSMEKINTCLSTNTKIININSSFTILIIIEKLP